THFAGRFATPVTAFGPTVGESARTWERLATAVGLQHDPRPGDRVLVELSGQEAIQGTVYLRNRDTVGIRTREALLGFIAGFQGSFIAAHHLFNDADPAAAALTWEKWMRREIGREASN